MEKKTKGLEYLGREKDDDRDGIMDKDRYMRCGGWRI